MMRRTRIAAASVLAAGLIGAAAAPASAAPGALTAEPRSVKCGAQPVTAGEHFCGLALIMNSSTANLFVFPIEPTGDTAAFRFEEFFCTGVTLGFDDSCTVPVFFDPSEVGRSSAKFNLYAPAVGDVGSLRASGRGTD